MNAGFLNAWKLYRHGAKRPAFAGEKPRGEAAFDPEVKVGEIRVFADTNRPLVALVIEDCGLSGRRIVPVSPFAAPASNRETVVGERVFQLWNATQASRRFTDRSWRVDALTAEECTRVAEALAAAHPGRIVEGDGPQARYEREFLISAGNFIPYASPKVGSVPIRWVSGWSAVASVALLLGVCYLLVGESPERVVSAWPWPSVRYGGLEEEAEYEPIELSEPESGEIEVAESTRDEIQRSTRPQNSIPALPTPLLVAGSPRMALPNVAKMSDFEEVSAKCAMQKKGTDPAQEKGTDPSVAFVCPDVEPRTVLVAAARMSASEEVGKRPFAYAEGRPTRTAPGPVACMLTECPWNMSHRLLNVRIASAEGLGVAVDFDAASVGAYRRISSTDTPGAINAFYEIVPAKGLSALSADAVRVTTHWRGAEGAMRRVETLRVGDSSELPYLPQVPRQPKAVPEGSSPDDVPVNVNL